MIDADPVAVFTAAQLKRIEAAKAEVKVQKFGL
jgi:hypothetical protein